MIHVFSLYHLFFQVILNLIPDFMIQILQHQEVKVQGFQKGLNKFLEPHPFDYLKFSALLAA